MVDVLGPYPGARRLFAHRPLVVAEAIAVAAAAVARTVGRPVMTLLAAAVALELQTVPGVVDGRRRRCGEPEAVGESAAQPVGMTAFL
jgi:hypothetical protein